VKNILYISPGMGYNIFSQSGLSPPQGVSRFEFDFDRITGWTELFYIKNQISKCKMTDKKSKTFAPPRLCGRNISGTTDCMNHSNQTITYYTETQRRGNIFGEINKIQKSTTFLILQSFLPLFFHCQWSNRFYRMLLFILIWHNTY
jgi:hypothetical protein